MRFIKVKNILMKTVNYVNYGKGKFSQLKLLELKFKGWYLKLTPKYGACILRCSHKNFDILRPAETGWERTHDPMLTSYFPLVPYSNRIANGQFQWENEHINLKPNHVSQQFPLHGIGWLSEWVVLEIKENGCILEYKNSESDWPWPFSVKQEITLKKTSMKISLTLENIGRNKMPAGLGFHPYFPLTKDLQLQFNAKSVYLSDDDNLPTKLTLVPNKWDFSHSKSVFETKVDNCFSGYDGKAHMTVGKKRYNLFVLSTKSLDHCVFYVPKNGNFFCLEPVNHMNNALALNPIQGVTLMPSLGPGEINHVEMLFDTNGI